MSTNVAWAAIRSSRARPKRRWTLRPAAKPGRIDVIHGQPEPAAGPVTLVKGRPEAVLLSDVVVVLETNLDDMSPEHLPYLLEHLMDEGALDASLQALQMKKGRPGQLLRVIARPADRDHLARRILAESWSKTD